MPLAPVPPLIEKTSALYTAQLIDETGTPVSGSVLFTFTLTLYDLQTGTIINGRNNQNVLNANGVTIDSNGNVAWSIAPADTIILSNELEIETHIALFQATWNAGAKRCNHEVAIPVQVLNLVS